MAMAKIKGNKKGNKLKGKKGPDQMAGLGGDDVLLGKAGDDALKGGSGDDILDGGTGSDIMKGGAGNDRFVAGEGGDLFDGGAGIDLVDFSASLFGVTVEFLLQTDTFDGLQRAYRGIENIDGSAFGDTLEGDGAANHFRGLGGKDYLKGGDGNDILDGGEGDDQIYFDAGADQLIGGNGYDTLVYEDAPGGVNINLAEGKGSGAAAGDTFSGFERVFATKHADIVSGTSIAEVLFGEAGDDDLYGNGGNDTLHGGAGKDDLLGGEGDDWLVPGSEVAEADDLHGGNGSDWADYDDAGGAVTVNLRAGTSGGRAAGDTYDSIENVRGSDYGDTLVAGLNGRAYGGWGDDFIYDNTGTEVLRGGRGTDVLNDSFFGAEDGLRDIFVLEVGLDMDTVQGFTQSSGATGDRFWLPEEQFDIVHDANGAIGAGQILNATSSAATSASHRLIFDTDAGDRILYYDADGSGAEAAPVAIAKLQGVASIQDYDFVVVPNL